MTERAKKKEKEEKFLTQRYEEYCIKLLEDQNVSGSSKMLGRNKFLLCKEHENDKKWSEVNGQCQHCVKYTNLEVIDGGLLSRGEDVMNRLLTLKAKNSGRQVNNEFECAAELFCHWIHCNVYPKTMQAIAERIKTMFTMYGDLKRSTNKTKTDAYWEKYIEFMKTQTSLFDVRDEDSVSTAAQEKFWGVTMTDKDESFYQDQKSGARREYCTRSVDPRWRANHDRKLKRLQRTRNESYDSADLTGVSWTEHSEEVSEVSKEHEDSVVCEETSTSTDATVEVPQSGKKRKYEFVDVQDDADDDLPQQYRNIRRSSGKRTRNDGQRSVRPEIYYVAGILSSKYHMSQSQVEGAIITVANELFGRKYHGKWKIYDRDTPQDKNTLPAMSNIRSNQQCMETMALSMIVEEIMKDDSDTTIVYSNDGSGMSGVGKYIVQSLNVNGVKRTLPTLGIFTESRESLADLMKDTMKMMTAASANKYSEKDLVEKIGFVMSDSTSHNLKVIEKVCEDLEVEDVPSTILCNVHPLMMFQGKIKALCQLIHDTLGNEKINNCFMVDVEFRKESFVIKAITCLSNFINSEYSAKPWNRSSHFTEFIRPKDNMSISLIDHCFNRLMDCSLALLYHFEDIDSYLDKFTSVNNDITVLDRSFVEMDILKPIFAAISLLGIHFTRPFHHLVISTDTNYSTLLKAFPALYRDLTEIKASEFLTVDQVASFVTPEIFAASLPEKCLLDKLSLTLDSYSAQISKFLEIAIKMFADGISLQKGAIFGFGPNKDEDTGTVLKLSSLSQEEVQKMDDGKVQVHNLGEERTVGCFNYEISIRGKSNLETASRNIVLNRSADLIAKVDPTTIKSFRKQTKEVKKLKIAWNKKMKDLEEKGYSEKEILNTKRDETKLNDLDKLKKAIPPGPFTKREDVQNYMDDELIDDKIKNDRLYTEVRYARKTSLSLKETAAVFRLKTAGQQNLTSDEYAENLMQYLDNARNIGSISVEDLNSALLGILPQLSGESSDSHIGEHVAVLVKDTEDKITWSLGIIDSVIDSNTYKVAIMISNEGLKWTFPDTAVIANITNEQVLSWKVPVRYWKTAKIRCSMDKKLVEKLNQDVESLKKSI